MLILEKLLKMTSLEVDSVLIETTDLNFNHSSAKIKIDVGISERLGLDGGSPQRSARLAEKCNDEIFTALNGAEFILGITDLGCDDGEGIPPVVTDVAKNNWRVDSFCCVHAVWHDAFPRKTRPRMFDGA